MPGSLSGRHRSGPLKQENKSHKHGRHRTNRGVESDKRGRLETKVGGRKIRKGTSKAERRNQTKTARALKRAAVIEKKRNLGSGSSPPFLTCIVSLCDEGDANCVLANIVSSADDNIVNSTERNVTVLCAPRFKQRFCFVCPRPGFLYDALDAVKIADTVILVWPLSGELSSQSESLLSCIFGQGLPASIHIVPGFSSLSSKQKETCRKSVNKLLEKWSFEPKFASCDSGSDGLNLLRQIGTGKKKRIVLQERKPQVLIESLEATDLRDSECTLKAYGYVRGPALDVNGLIHVPGFGDFQMKEIELFSDPYVMESNSKHKEGGDSSMIESCRTVLASADPKIQENLQSEVIPDPMEGEQTWPTEQELAEADLAAANKVVKKVPKGTSEYQAAWILDENEEEAETSGVEPEEEEESEEEDDVEEGVSVEYEDEEDDEMEDAETMTVTSQVDTDRYDERMDMTEEKLQLDRFRKERENEMFPDEIDTPLDTPARVRFQKYRGLKSFRTSPWNSEENLPEEYSRIFQFADFKRTKKRVLNQDRDGALHGWYVCIHIANVPVAVAESLKTNKTTPLVLYGLLSHEQKISVVNMVIKKHPSCRFSVKSKDRLIFHVGHRRFAARPIFSEHTNGDKHKYQRFLPVSEATVASVFAPITYPPASVLVFREDGKGRHQLVATGGLLDIKPKRVVVKRIVLSGHPVKINKRSAVVRYLFFNPEDIEWFKPVELRSKMGRRGHIKDSLGTHGHFKCTFDRQLNSQDTVLMNLYKRVFPKWTYDPIVSSPTELRALTSVPSSADSMDTC